MQIKAEKSKFHRFTFYYDFTPDRLEFCRILKDSFGWQRFSYNAAEGQKRWVFSEAVFVQLLVQKFPQIEIDPEVKRIVEHEQGQLELQEKQKEIVDVLREKKDTNFKVLGIKGEMYPYQKIGVEFLLASGGRAIISDPPGLGKSLQALGYIAHNKFSRSLIIAPASVKSSWAKEIKKWTSLSYIEIDSKTDLSQIPADTKLWVINYDILKKHLNTLLKTRFDVFVADECHYLKNQQAARTKAVKMLSKHIPHVVMLSGTPLLSRPVEMFTLLNMVDPSTWNNWHEFTRKYCDAKQGRWGYDVSGASNTEELHDRIKRYFIRRQKKDVLTQLPPKNRIEVPVELPTDYRKEYDEAENNLAMYLKQYAGKQPAEIAKAVAAEKLTQLNILRHLSAMGKLSTAEEIVESVLEADEKILVFSSFVEPLEILKEKLGDKAVIITGKTDVNDRGAIVSKFQDDPNTKVFLGGMKSAGVGITLTAASNVLFLDYAWNPADMQQAEDRIHRPGQEASSVNIYQLHAEDTIDTKLQKILKHKQEVFDQVVEGVVIKRDDEEVLFRSVLDDLMVRQGVKREPMVLTQ